MGSVILQTYSLKVKYSLLTFDSQVSILPFLLLLNFEVFGC